MARSLSPAARQALFAQQTGEAIIILLTLTEASLPAPIRVCTAGEDVVSNGETYQHFPFEITMPDDTADAPPTVRLTIDAVDRQIIEAVRSVGGAITVEMQIVFSSDLDQVEVIPGEFKLNEVEYSALTIEGTLSFEPILDEPYPADTFTPAKFPGMPRR